MLTLDMYSELYKPSPQGRAHKDRSDIVMLHTWERDVQSQIGYIYDYYHDAASEDKRKFIELHPENDENKTPINVKVVSHVTQTFSKDIITHHLQLQPGQQPCVDYYEEYKRKYGNVFPIGFYIDLMDEAGVYNKWLVCQIANYYEFNFPTFEILPCNYVFQWIHKGKKYEVAGVTRSQNS